MFYEEYIRFTGRKYFLTKKRKEKVCKICKRSRNMA